MSVYRRADVKLLTGVLGKLVEDFNCFNFSSNSCLRLSNLESIRLLINFSLLLELSVKVGEEDLRELFDSESMCF